MSYFLAILVPCIFLLSFLFAAFKKVRVYDSFTDGVKETIPLILSIFPYVAAVTMLTKLLEMSGINDKLAAWLHPLFSFVGVPEEIAPFLFIKPLSGNGALAVLSEILDRYGVDSYISRCACVIHGATDTIFYIGAVYFAGLQRKKFGFALAIALFCYVFSIIFGCFLCQIM